MALALQGGGAHGAFTRGVLETLLEHGRLAPVAVSGTSAGALNAAALVSGWVRGGREGAAEALTSIWNAVASAGGDGPLAALASTRAQIMGQLPRIASPYQFNPAGLNPLRGIIERHVDFDALRHRRAPRLLIAAASVHSGRTRLFDNTDLSVNALLASTCLPFLFQAVEIDGEHYWDGGYSSNPPVLALARRARVRDVLIVQLNPLWRPEVPTRVDAIADRVRELGFNASLMRELELLATLPAWRRLGLPRLHRIGGEGHTDSLPPHQSLNTDRRFLERLSDAGRERAAQWLRDDRRRLWRGDGIGLPDWRPQGL
jgi:NTE family protein